MTRHWIEAIIDGTAAGVDLICEHPKACMDTAEGVRAHGCCVRDFFDNSGTDMFQDDGPVTFGRVEVAVSWRGSDEDAEPLLTVIDSSAVSVFGCDPAGTAEESNSVRMNAVCRPDSPVTHELKTWPSSWPAVAADEKRFEVRRNDRDYRTGDILRLAEYDPDKQEYTGRGCVRRVAYVLPGGQFGLDPGYVAMSLEVVDGQGRSEPNWRRIAIQLVRHEGTYHGLATSERDALEGALAEVGGAL